MSRHRGRGESKYTFWRMVDFALVAAFSFSATPVRLIGRAGFVITGLSGLYLGYVLVRALFFGGLVRGWASTIGVVSILGGLQLVGMGVIGEYLAKVFEEAKNRPLYFFKQTPRDVSAAPADAPPEPDGEEMSGGGSA